MWPRTSKCMISIAAGHAAYGIHEQTAVLGSMQTRPGSPRQARFATKGVCFGCRNGHKLAIVDRILHWRCMAASNSCWNQGQAADVTPAEGAGWCGGFGPKVDQALHAVGAGLMPAGPDAHGGRPIAADATQGAIIRPAHPIWVIIQWNFEALCGLISDQLHPACSEHFPDQHLLSIMRGLRQACPCSMHFAAPATNDQVGSELACSSFALGNAAPFHKNHHAAC